MGNMKKVFSLCMMLFLFFFLCRVFTAVAAMKVSPGEQAFMKNCAVCHPGGGNIEDSAKTLKRKDLNANGVKKPTDIIGKMRNPGPGMTKFDEKEIPDREARAIAEYILKTFR
jgi:cytochrome c6